MQPPSRLVVALVVLVCVTSAMWAGVAAAGTTGAAGAGSLAGGAPATHSFVQFNVSAVETDPGGAVAARVTFHNAYGAVFAVTGPDGFRYEAELSPVGGVQTVVRFDTAAAGRGDPGALTAVDGVVANATVTGASRASLPAGTYNVTLATGGVVRDSMPLRVGDADGTPPQAMAAQPTRTPGGPTAVGDDTAGESRAAAPGLGVGSAFGALVVAAVATLGLVRRRR
ncbi:hypothetical protein [Halobaculum marinum]|uniref:PGF-CTERM protein n=1 Tax=Halobaculum marinum TaxID=3031996 RepID=A0ABD5WZR1_9EURY|nr:hypothetical protein [Halobaculum sp. DT55]